MWTWGVSEFLKHCKLFCALGPLDESRLVVSVLNKCDNLVYAYLSCLVVICTEFLVFISECFLELTGYGIEDYHVAEFGTVIPTENSNLGFIEWNH